MRHEIYFMGEKYKSRDTKYKYRTIKGLIFRAKIKAVLEEHAQRLFVKN